jgi:hypothetical protein
MLKEALFHTDMLMYSIKIKMGITIQLEISFLKVKLEDLLHLILTYPNLQYLDMN